MVELFWFLFWALLSAFLVVAGLRVYARRRAALVVGLPSVDDDAVRSIVETGALSIEVDEPLDLREIVEEEERFWSESWEEPEEM